MPDNFKEEYEGSMDSKYYFSSSKVGATASPQTPNQLGETTSRLNQGLKAVELGTLNQRLLDQVPKEHFDEVRRLNKLTGAQASLHAPIQDLDLAGFTQQGWDKHEREVNAQKLVSSLDKAHKMDPEGNTPVTVHAGGMMAQRWKKEGLKTEEGKPIKDARTEMAIVNQDTGQIQGVKYKEKEYFGGKPVIYTPERSMNTLNKNEWDREQLQIMQWKKAMHEVEDRTAQQIARMNIPTLEYAKQQEEKTGKKILTDEEGIRLEKAKEEKQNAMEYAKETYFNIRSLMEDMNNRFNKYPPKEKEELNPKEKEEIEGYKKFKERIKPEMKKLFDYGQKEIDRVEKKLKEINAEYEKAKTEQEKIKIYQKLKGVEGQYFNAFNQQTDMMSKYVQQMPAPKTWVSIDEFSKDKVSDSVSEAALKSFKKYKDKSPLILLENVYPEMALSRADSLKKAVETSRKKFRSLLIKKQGLSEEKAKETAEKLIGVTWDVGHIYQLKKYGYSDEDILEEAKKIAPYVKHAHLTDNFGFEDSHLPPGLGEVNIKKQLKALEKAGFKGRGIVEAGEFVANFKEVPHLYALSHLSSPLYVDKTEPYWQQIWDQYGVYFAGHGEMLPQKYFDLYGPPGFAQLPPSLGGSAKSPEKGRFAASGGGEEV